MIVRFARHGQPWLEGMASDGNFEFPDGDYILTSLGRKQAKFLGEHLKNAGFKGKVIASPYARTAETASIAAAVCGLDVYFEPRLQEMRFYPDRILNNKIHLLWQNIYVQLRKACKILNEDQL